MSLELQELVAAARSSRSTSITLSPRPAASRAMPAPLMPPPTTSRSMTPGEIELMCVPFFVLVPLRPPLAPRSPPHDADDGLGIGDDALSDPLHGVAQLRLEGDEVLAHVEVVADVPEAPRPEE